MIAGITEKEQKIIEHILDKYRKNYAFFYYGSRVKGTYEKTSDLDVLIKGKAEMPLAILQEIKEEFDKSDLPYIVNFSDYYKLDSSFYERIKPDLIPYNWQEVKLGDVCKFQNGKKRPKNKGVYPVYGGNGILEYSDDFNFTKGLIIGRVGAYCGNVFISKGACWISDNAISGTNMHNTDLVYLYYALKGLCLNKRSIGSGQPLITQDILNNITIQLPPLDVQKKIAGVLGALDDKIELNNKINQNLEAQAQALFKSWFVDFEPFGGKMPDDWKIGRLGEIADITMGQSPNGSSYNEDKQGCIFFQGRAEFGKRFPSVRLYTTEPKRMAKKNDILMSVRAPVGDFNIAVEDCCIGRGLCSIRAKGNFQSFVLYTIWGLQKQLEIFNGEGTVFGAINKDSLNSLPITIPSLTDIVQFEHIVSSLDNIIRNNFLENTRLAELRDTLLPKLMSGEINVDDVKID